MADQYDPTPPNAWILSYVQKNADYFKSYTSALGYPQSVAVAAAVGVSEEARSVVPFGWQAGPLAFGIPNPKDVILDEFNSPVFHRVSSARHRIVPARRSAASP